ncbi:alpha/beta fold hydrolase [Bradyrhizobium manausense]|nr:alpha/beta fold hydrolase [Bradyrhizobium manausense]
MWDDVVARMPAGVRILRYDSRGHGQSDLGRRSPTIEELGCDVIDIMDAFEIPRAVFCGVSLGGLTGQWLGAMFPERLDGLILANTAPNFPPASMWLDRRKQHATAAYENWSAPLSIDGSPKAFRPDVRIEWLRLHAHLSRRLRRDMPVAARCWQTPISYKFCLRSQYQSALSVGNTIPQQHLREDRRSSLRSQTRTC